MLRSMDMTLCDVYIQTEAGFDVLHNIGELGCVQFKDINRTVSTLDKKYMNDLCRCADIERNLNYMREEMLEDGTMIPRLRDLSHVKPLHPTEMSEFENMIDSGTKDVKDMSINHMNLKKMKSETKEIHYVFNHLDPILGDVQSGHTKLPKKVTQAGRSDRRKLKIITGVVDRSTSYHFQTMLWRLSHGNIYYKEAPHDEKFQSPVSGGEILKVAFVVICHGDELHQRILKVCNGFNISLYRWPDNHEDRLVTMDELTKRMKEMDKVLQRTRYQRAATFRNIAAEWETWMAKVLKAKAIYYQLNLFNVDISSNTLIGQCWVPERRYDEVEAVLESTSETLGARSFMVKTVTDATPPTLYRTNRLTEGFQKVVNSYQIGRYKELNAGIFSVVSFPFLFGVMFGDIGHGLIMLLYGLWMINNEKKFMYRVSTNEVFDLLFQGRYMIVMMGLFSMFMGFLYNEIFSLQCKLQEPYWLNTFHLENMDRYEDEWFDVVPEKGRVGFVYKYGIDPGLKLAGDGFLIETTLKMKLAIIIGVAHTVFGLLISLWNVVYFKKYYAIFLHFLPKLTFVLCIYGFLVYLIFYKWLFPVNILDLLPVHVVLYELDFRKFLPNLRDEFLHFVLWAERPERTYIVRVVSRFLKREVTIVDNYYDLDQLKATLYHIALASFPVMLLGSPIYLYVKNRIKTSIIERRSDIHELSVQDSVELKKYKEFSLGGYFLNRIWRTMEFGLGTVSYMASYLRLWALSMVHALLSDFFWSETMRKFALSDRTVNGIWKIYFVFFLWALITLFFLVLMDGLAAFVHTLRLHWIEFMSRFFKGDGVPFRPFVLSNVLDVRDVRRDEETAFISKRRARENTSEYY